MATLHKFVSSGTSLTIDQETGYSINYPSYSYYVPNGYSGYNISNVDITNVKNQQIEIVTQSTTTKFLSHPNFSSSTTHCQEITPPTPTQESDGYHYIFPANTFTYNKVAALGNFIKTAGSNHYYSTFPIIKAYAGGAHWEDVNIPEYSDPATYTVETFNTGNTTYQYSNIYYQKYNYYIGQTNQAATGKLKYFALPAGVKQFYATSPRIAVTTTMAVGQLVQYFYPTETVDNKYYYDISSFTDSANYVILLDSGGTKGYDGTAGVNGGWGIGSTHKRVSGSWT